MVYILEFSEPLGNSNHQARFYVGWCEDDRLTARFYDHINGRGAKITAAAVQRGIGLKIVATLAGGRDVEKKIKRQKNTRRVVERLILLESEGKISWLH